MPKHMSLALRCLSGRYRSGGRRRVCYRYLLARSEMGTPARVPAKSSPGTAKGNGSIVRYSSDGGPEQFPLLCIARPPSIPPWE